MCDDFALRLSTVHLTDYERIVLEYVRIWTWGRATRRKRQGQEFPDAVPFTETPRQMAARIGLGRMDAADVDRLRKRLYDALAGLKRARILIEADAPDDSRHGAARGLIINTDCDSWELGSREVLPEFVAVRYALAMQNAYRDLPEPEILPAGDADFPPLTEFVAIPSPQSAVKTTNVRPPTAEKDSVSRGITPIGTRASEDFRKTKSKKTTPLPPADGGPEGGVVVSQDPTFNSEFEAEVYRMVLASPGYATDRALAWGVTVQFRAQVEAGQNPASVHGAYLGAKSALPLKPSSWPTWVGTTLERRKAERKATAPPAGAAPPELTPERVAKIKALREQSYERWDSE